MVVYHILSFTFKGDTSVEERRRIHLHALGLGTNCKASSGKVYILEHTGGSENISPEGMLKDYHNTYVTKFASIQDRDYFINEDSYHLTFKARVFPFVSDAYIYDYEV